jgi:DNA-binding transcriptional LysR family regulator
MVHKLLSKIHQRFNAARQSAKLVLLPIVTRFLQAFPGVNVEMVINDALVDMVSGGAIALVRRSQAYPRHGRARPGHPRLAGYPAAKTWMPGTKPGMTNS